MIAMIVCLLFAPVLCAQESTARLLGTVTDPTGAVVPAANVAARNTATGLTRKTVANESGDYSIPLLPIGQYTVTADSAGFKTSTINGLVLQVSQEARLDITLVLGSAAESIQVEASSPLLVTDGSSVGQVVENIAIANMPLNGRAFWQLAQLTPGAVYTPGGSDISAGGQGIRASRVNLRISGNGRLNGGWFLDGFDITEYELGATSITPSTDALEEFKVLAGGMSAEYSLPSVINAALKSGSNRVHGSVYEYLRNEKIQARNFFAQSVPPLKRNQFGTTLGGPIKRDRIFIFGFSRGAFTAQAVAAMVFSVGLLDNIMPHLVPYAFRIFQEKSRMSGWKGFKDVFGYPECPVHFLGLWDTVYSVGWTLDFTLAYMKSNPSVGIVRCRRRVTLFYLEVCAPPKSHPPLR
jgi:hypothetical protein